jgi:hypothetical protein
LVQAAAVGALAALVAGVAAALGGMLGARIAGNAAREAARIAQQEAKAGREESRQARFADRTLELASRLLDVAKRYRFAYTRRLSMAGVAPTPEPKLDDATDLAMQELRLVVRLPQTYEAISRLSVSLTLLELNFPLDPSVDGMNPTSGGEPVDPVAKHEAELEFLSFAEQCDVERRKFENAIRLELGLVPISEHSFDWSIGPDEDEPGLVSPASSGSGP